MAIVFIEGFDKYGPSFTGTTTFNTVPGANLALAMRGIWTVSIGASGSSPFIAAPLSSNGGSLLVSAGAGQTSGGNHSLPANYATAIGGFRFQATTLAAGIIMQLKDSATVQASISLDSSGHVIINNAAGTALATSTTTIATGAPHYLEWSIGMSATGAYTVYLDGLAILTGTGNFHGSANNFYNTIFLGVTGASHVLQYDDLYVDDGSGAALLTSPVVQTQFPSSDSSVAFAQGAYSVGYWNATGAQSAPGVVLALRQFTCPAGGVTLNSNSIVPNVTNGTVKFKAVLYADSAGAPGALTATGTEVVGCVAATALVLPFASGQVLTAGTAYWIGYITDTSVAIYVADTLGTGRTKANTYASGAPNPAGVTVASASWMIWGNCTAASTNSAVEAEQQPLGVWGDFGYVVSSNVGDEDLFGFPALSGSPISVYAVAVSGYMRDQAAGARTVTLNTKSGATDSPGSNAGFTPTTTYGWASTILLVDPSTTTAWTVAGVNAATSGYKITA